MKKLAVFSIAAFSISLAYAADPQPSASESTGAPKPPPPVDEMDHSKRGGHEMDRRAWRKMEWSRKGKDAGMHGERGPRGDHAKLFHDLNLTPEQKEKAKTIMEAAKPKIEAIRKEEREKIKAVMDETFKALRPLLTPEQQTVFDSIQKLRADRAALKLEKPAQPTKSEGQ